MYRFHKSAQAGSEGTTTTSRAGKGAVKFMSSGTRGMEGRFA
jgi:hypothetical protein